MSGYYDNVLCRVESTSLWGRELKWTGTVRIAADQLVDLLVRSWIEIHPTLHTPDMDVVDLLVRSWIEMTDAAAPWLKSYVDLLVRSWIEILFQQNLASGILGRPPCEVVNWNVTSCIPLITSLLSTSLWGRELKCTMYRLWYFLHPVDLLVRSWIEKIISYSWYYSKSTARNVYIS